MARNGLFPFLWNHDQGQVNYLPLGKSISKYIGLKVLWWRRKWQSTPVFLHGEFHGQSLAGCSPWSHKELDPTESHTHTHTHTHTHLVEERYLNSSSWRVRRSLPWNHRSVHTSD